MIFANWYFLLLIPIIVYLFLKKKKLKTLKFSNINLIKDNRRNKKFIYNIGKYLILLGTICLIIALARPQKFQRNIPNVDEGIDIALLLDASGSMESVDFDPSRLEVAKDTIEKFVENRNNDRIAFIVFAGNAYTRIPLTLDHDILSQSIEGISVDAVNEDGTAIGMSISVGMNRLKKSESPTKIMILVTDGDNNAGSIDPISASELASDLGIKIYTIGVGTDKTILPVSYFGITQYQEVEGGLNEELLQTIADNTGGNYYRAKDEDSLEEIFEDIDRLEKTNFEEDSIKQYYEYGFDFMKIGMILLLIGLFFDKYYYIKIP